MANYFISMRFSLLFYVQISVWLCVCLRWKFLNNTIRQLERASCAYIVPHQQKQHEQQQKQLARHIENVKIKNCDATYLV